MSSVLYNPSTKVFGHLHFYAPFRLQLIIIQDLLIRTFSYSTNNLSTISPLSPYSGFILHLTLAVQTIVEKTSPATKVFGHTKTTTKVFGQKDCFCFLSLQLDDITGQDTEERLAKCIGESLL